MKPFIFGALFVEDALPPKQTDIPVKIALFPPNFHSNAGIKFWTFLGKLERLITSIGASDKIDVWFEIHFEVGVAHEIDKFDVFNNSCFGKLLG